MNYAVWFDLARVTLLGVENVEPYPLFISLIERMDHQQIDCLRQRSGNIQANNCESLKCGMQANFSYQSRLVTPSTLPTTTTTPEDIRAAMDSVGTKNSSSMKLTCIFA